MRASGDCILSKVVTKVPEQLTFQSGVLVVSSTRFWVLNIPSSYPRTVEVAVNTPFVVQETPEKFGGRGHHFKLRYPEY